MLSPELKVCRNNSTSMKKRIAFWLMAITLASIATAASFHLPVRQVNTDPDGVAKMLGVDPVELKASTHMANQLTSDLRHGRPAKENEVNHLMEVTKQGGAIAGEVYWQLTPLRKKAFRSKFVNAAVKSADSKNEVEAYAAISLLKYWNDSRWNSLAQKYPWHTMDYKAWIMEPRWGQ